jgi:2-dehydropantoate 2-reductase
MKIAVVGAGAMGSLFGGLLAAAGEKVILVDIWEEHVEAINTRGLIIEKNSTRQTIEVRATTDHSKVGLVDLIILFVKSYDTHDAIEDIKVIVSEDTVLLSLQNGLGNIEKISELIGKNKVIPGTTAQGCTLMGPGEIKHAGYGSTIIGEIDGRISKRIIKIRDTFNRAGIKTEISDKIKVALWSKVLVNIAINPVTALTGLRNGELLDHPEIVKVMLNAVEEAIRVAEALKIDLGFDEHIENVYKVARATYSNKSSMLQDIYKGKRTEIDALNGVIVASARRIGLPVPVNDTLTALVKGLEYNKLVYHPKIIESS